MCYNPLSHYRKDRDIYEVTATKTYTIAESYEKLGDYENAAIWYDRAIESNDYLGFEDAVRISKEKSRQFTTELSLYKRTYNKQAYFGAKNPVRVRTGPLSFCQSSRYFRSSVFLLIQSF